jgi:serine/threonine-protein kinase
VPILVTIEAPSVPAPESPRSDGSWPRSEDRLGLHEDGLVLEAGKVIGGKYVLEKPAGFGGMAEVWVATNQATDAHVCVKILVRANEEESIERFRREAHAAAKLSHRAIVRVFDLLGLDVNGEVTRRGPPHAYAIVMELLKGESLGDLLAKRGKLPLEEALDLYLPVMSALAHAHRASVIHRDLKPDNIFLAADPDGHIAPKVLDFGVSKMSNAESITNDGVVVGTPSFMSPEQAKGARHVDARSDVFSAGTLLYMMLSGSNPFEAENFASVVDAVLRRQVPPIPDVPAPIWEVVERALKKDPQERFPDATEMGIALRKASGRRVTTDSQAALPAFALTPSPSPSSPSLPVAISDQVSGVITPSRRAPSQRDGSLDSIPSTTSPDPADEVVELPMQSGRRLVVAAVGVAAMVLVAGVFLLSRGSTAETHPAAAPVASAASAAPARVDPVPDPPPATELAPSATSASDDAPPPAQASAAPVKPARSASPATTNRPASAPAGKRRSGGIIRDPGF